MTDEEKLFILEKKIKDLCVDKEQVVNIIINDIGEEAFYNENYEHELKQTLEESRLIVNALMIERRLLRESLGYDII